MTHSRSKSPVLNVLKNFALNGAAPAQRGRGPLCCGPFRLDSSVCRLEVMEKIRRPLRMACGGEDRPLVVFQRLEP
jgi:hypothetical protein